MRAPLLMLAATAAGLAGACDWTAFDDLRDRTPVLIVGPPGNYAEPADFGRLMLPLAPPSSGPAAGRYIVSSVTHLGLGEVDLDAAGRPSAQALNPTVISQGGGFPIVSMAAVPGTDQVLMGAPQPGGGRLYLMTVGATTVPSVALYDSSTTDDKLGLGVAAASFASGAAVDFVVVSTAAIRVYPAGAVAAPLVLATSAACPLTLSGDLVSRARLNRAVVTGPLLAGGASQVAVGTPSAVDPGTVSIFAVDASGPHCLFTLSQTPNRFGQALATGDFDGDGALDLLVGAPPHDAFLYRGPLAAGATPAQITYPDSGGEFGAALAALDADGKPGDEALIADSTSTVRGVEVAGAVAIFAGPALATMAGLLTAHDPVDSGAFGSTVAALPFCPSGCGAAARRLPLVGAADQTFTYFLLQSTDTDPRRR